MKKNITQFSIIVLVLGLFIYIIPAEAAPKAFELPASAVEIAPNVFDLGNAKDPKTGKMVQGLAIVHKKNEVRPNTVKGPKAPSCYGFLATGAKWKSVENWSVFSGAGLSGNFVLGNTTGNIAKWETASGGFDILGEGSIGTGAPGDPNVLDNKNEVSFAHISDGNTIAVTIVWGYLGGRTSNRELVAWDQIYNTDYSWSEDATGSTSQMDFENISTHELGHTVGMGDIYNSGCSVVTMYGYADFGETNKSSLESADIVGISALY